MRSAAEPPDVGDSAEEASRTGRADPVKIGQRTAGSGDELA
jgi:hypothetical protein